jgi:nucleotide sugar dehydrogenase
MKIYDADIEDVRWRTRRREVTLSMIGLGTVGLPMVTLFAMNGFKVIGFDVNHDRVRSVNSGNVTFEYQDELPRIVKHGLLRATNSPEEAVRQSDVVIISVPTPLNTERDADLSYVQKATEVTALSLEKGHLVVYESTVPIGTVRRMAHDLEALSNLKCAVDFGVASCPERYDPSLVREVHPKVTYDGVPTTSAGLTVDKIPRVVGGVDLKSTAIAAELYSAVISAGVFQVTSPEVAEASKMVENIFRNVNIALINELALVLSAHGLDTFEVVEAAKTKPFAFMAHYPGPGVGGECIPVVPWYLVRAAERMGIDPRLTRTSLDINQGMSEHTVMLIKEALKQAGKDIHGSRICILGLAYKKNVNDTRLSPAYRLADLLNNLNCDVRACDPFVQDTSEKFRQVLLEEAFDQVDAVVLVTDHDVFKSIDLAKLRSQMRPPPVIVDGRNFFDAQLCRQNGFIYRGIGKPMQDIEKVPK